MEQTIRRQRRVQVVGRLWHCVTTLNLEHRLAWIGSHSASTWCSLKGTW